MPETREMKALRRLRGIRVGDLVGFEVPAEYGGARGYQGRVTQTDLSPVWVLVRLLPEYDNHHYQVPLRDLELLEAVDGNP